MGIKTLPVGFFMMCLVLAFSLKDASLSLFFNLHAVILVIGGTLAALVMSTPIATLRLTFKTTAELFQKMQRVSDFREEFSELMARKSLRNKSNNELINYAVELWDQGTEADLFIVLISQRRDDLERGHVEVVQALRNLAKYPPALGMTGTVMGLVSLFGELGVSSKDKLGPSLALAMTATFFGLIIANCVVTPLADHLHVRHMQQERLFTSIYELLILINRNEATALVRDEVESRAAA